MNGIFFAIVVVAFTVAGLRQFDWDPRNGGSSPMEVLSIGMIDAAGGAVTLAIGLVGAMALFLGLMKVAEAGGLLTIIAKTLRPLMIRLFPEVPEDHPAMGAIVMNLSANALGLGNAATPFGIRAMEELDKLNPNPGTATNAMALFLAINTSSVTLLPTGVIALRAAAGSEDPAGILPTTLFATICSTTVAILVAKLCQNFWPATATPGEAGPHSTQETDAAQKQEDYSEDVRAMADKAGHSAYPFWISAIALVTIICLVSPDDSLRPVDFALDHTRPDGRPAWLWRVAWCADL